MIIWTTNIHYFVFFFNLKNFTKKWLQNWNFSNLYAATKNLASTLYAWSGLTLKSIFWKKSEIIHQAFWNISLLISLFDSILHATKCHRKDWIDYDSVWCIVSSYHRPTSIRLIKNPVNLNRELGFALNVWVQEGKGTRKRRRSNSFPSVGVTTHSI